MKAWHFVNDTLRDGIPIPADGELLRFDGKPILCQRGLHASLDPFDALQFAPGQTLCLVACGGMILHQKDKLVCTERTIIVRMDAEPLLRYFARMQALSCAHLWTPDQVVCDYLMTGDESIRAAARDPAWAAARAPASPARTGPKWLTRNEHDWHRSRRVSGRAVGRYPVAANRRPAQQRPGHGADR